MSTENKQKPLNILIADDSSTVRKYIMAAIKDFPVSKQIYETDNGQTCLSHLDSNFFDVAYIDVNMPGMTGIEALTFSRQNGSKTFVVLMSTNVDDQKRDKARELGAYDYLRKPMKPAVLCDILRSYIRFKTTAQVLIVDDSSPVRKIVKRLLDESIFNLTTTEAHSAHTAVVGYQNNQPDIMFLDLNMPDANGLEALRMLTEIGERPKTILMTGDHNVEFSAEMMELGVVSLLYKPFYPEDVERVMHEIFELRPPSLGEMEKIITLQDGDIAKTG